MKPRAWFWALLVGALAGVVFAGVSTFDFIQHLDRQVHSLHCSFLPGAGADTAASGCQTAMMSPYSSVFRTSIWGGIPISLAAMTVFAFILFYALDLLVTRRLNDVRATGFLALATCLPAAASLTMLTISLVKLGTFCEVCLGIYIASALCLISAIVLWRRAVGLRATMPDALGESKAGTALLEVQVETPPATNGFLAAMFGAGVLFVALPITVYALMAPDHGRFVGTCGELVQPQDTYGVMVPMHKGGDASALEILDPLCPACKAFESRLEATGFADRLDRKAILFPLDTTCNWMITENTHPGACAVSEAVLCAGDRAPQVIAWAFDVQARIRKETEKDPAAAARIVRERFPDLAACVGSPEAKSRLNKSMRWVVANNIRVLTPQLYINGVKLCDEDVDLGLDYALAKMLDGDMPERPAIAKPVEPPAMTHVPAPTTDMTRPATKPTTPTPSDTPVTTPSGTATDTPPASAATDKPSATPTDKPATTATETPATTTTDKPAATTTDKPAATDKPATDKPADRLPPEEKPAPAPTPADKQAPPPGDTDTTGGTP